MALVAIAFVIGCGGAADTADVQSVRGPGYAFAAPAGWTVSRRPPVVSVAPGGSDVDLVSVSTYRLARVPRTEEIDAAAAKLARTLKGRVTSSASIRVSARPARQFELAYAVEGQERGVRLTFLLRGRVEFQLLCRWEAPPGDEITAACQQLLRTFTLR